jgi:hypothetical protein
MDINLSLSPAPGITNYLVVAIYKASAPTTLIASQAFAAPHTSSVNVIFSNVDNAVYNVVTYESTTTAPTGTIRHQFIYNPSYINAIIRPDLVLTVGAGANNPVAGTNTFTLASLAGLVYSIERKPYGTMEQGAEIALSSNNQTLTLLTSGDVFSNGEKLVIHFQPQITTTQTPSNQSAGIIFSGGEVLSSDTVLDNTHIGKAIILQGTNPTLAITLPDFSSFADNVLTAFVSEGGNHINATLQTANGSQFFAFNGANRTKIYLGQCERIWLYKYNSKLYVFNADGNFKTVGEIVHHPKKQDNSNPLTTGELNTVFADGSTLSRALYPRLWEWVQTLDASDLVSDAVWNTADANARYTNKGKFSTGDGSTTFRLPILYDTGFLRAVDGVTRKAGSFEYPTLMYHEHEESIGNLPDSPFGQGSTSRHQGLYNGEGTVFSDLTGPPRNSDGTTLQSNPVLGPALAPSSKATNNNTPANTGIYLMIRI